MHATVQEYYRRIDAHDVESLLELFAENARYERPGYDPLVGRSALRQFYFAARVIESGAHAIARVVEAGDSVAVEGRFSGELKDGRHVELGFADFFVLSAEMIVGRRTYFYTPMV